eukprot:scaffold11606_cov56-Attheya_sp.AAC.1
MAVRVVVIGRDTSDLDGPQGNKVTKQVGQRVTGIRNEGRRMAGNAHAKLSDAEEQIDDDTHEGDAIGSIFLAPNVAERISRGGVFENAHAQLIGPGNGSLDLTPRGIGKSQYGRRQPKQGPIGCLEPLVSNERRYQNGQSTKDHSRHAPPWQSPHMPHKCGGHFLHHLIAFLLVRMLLMPVRMTHMHRHSRRPPRRSRHAS